MSVGELDDGEGSGWREKESRDGSVEGEHVLEGGEGGSVGDVLDEDGGWGSSGGAVERFEEDSFLERRKKKNAERRVRMKSLAREG